LSLPGNGWGFAFIIKGEWDKAIESDLEMLASSEQLLAIDPSSLDYARDKATALDHVGDSYRFAKIIQRRLEYGRRGLAMYDEILKQDRKTRERKKTLAIARITYLKRCSLRRITAARYCCCCDVALRRELVALDQSNVEYPDDLANSLVRRGEGAGER